MIWIKITDQLPPEGVVVMTKIHDEAGERNMQPLVLVNNKLAGKLFFFPDRSMYIYYTPTHWAYINQN